MVVNCHHVPDPDAPRSSRSPWQDSGQFPLQTYRGNQQQVLECLRRLFDNERSGVNKVVILLDESLPEAKLGQAPQDL